MGSKDEEEHLAPPPQPPSHLLEITIISAQDLSTAARFFPAYAVAWVDPAHKLSTHLDKAGGANPNWNDKFVFRVDDPFIKSETAGIMIQIYASRRLLPDLLIGTVRVIVSAHRPTCSSTRVVALQVRRPSSRPQGILNVGLAYLRRAPTYSGLHPHAFAYRDLMTRKSPPQDPRDLRRSLTDEGERSRGLDLLLQRSGSGALGSRVVEMERVELQSKLDKWRTELPETPDLEIGDGEGTWRKKRRRSVAVLSCLFGTPEPPVARKCVEAQTTAAC